MTITVNSAVLSSGQPSAPRRVVVLNVDLDNSYPTGGYDVSDQLAGGTPVFSETVIDYDGSALRYLKLAADGKVQAFVQTDGAPGIEVGNGVDVSGHTGVVINAFTE